MTAFRTATGTPRYEAPEIRGDVPVEDEEEHEGYTDAVDMWSLGCVVYEMAASAGPFPNYPRDYKKLCWGRWFPDKPPSLSQQGWDFIKSLLVLVPARRLSSKEALKHEWFTFPLDNAQHLDKKSVGVEMSPSSNDSLLDYRDLNRTVQPTRPAHSHYEVYSSKWKTAHTIAVSENIDYSDGIVDRMNPRFFPNDPRYVLP
jgi:serine/threonine protein kinase